jgi:hypothetical protein
MPEASESYKFLPSLTGGGCKEVVVRIAKWKLALGGVAAMGALSACGGGNQNVTPYLYTLGGTVSGLTADGLVLTNVGGTTLAVAAGATTFTFSGSVNLGLGYSVSVSTQPTGETCALANATGVVSGNVTSVAVSCQAGTFSTPSTTKSPSARVRAATAADAAGNLWMFGGAAEATANGTAIGDFWRFDAASQDWVAVKASGAAPGARVAAAATLEPNGRFMLFGGSDANGFHNDLWEYTVSTAAWTQLSGAAGANSPGVYAALGHASPSVSPGARTGAAAWSDAAGNFWLFGGSGIDADGTSGLLDDLWKYTPATQQWTWVGGLSLVGADASIGSWPGARANADAWTDANGNFWLFGGTTTAAGPDELWKYDATTATWTSVSQFPQGAGDYPQVSNKSAYRASSTGTTSAATSAFTLFRNGEIWSFNPDTANWTWVAGQASSPGTDAAGCAASTPGSLAGASTWPTATGNVWIFGGSTESGSAPTACGTLWHWTPAK